MWYSRGGSASLGLGSADIRVIFSCVAETPSCELFGMVGAQICSHLDNRVVKRLFAGTRVL
ncbi:MAG: hypothetical protein J07HR59_01488 [Halorubrum sp. J07HR59]|nr:MAG: hypothetical protein J07HR59_01488 [Halorubrum sp. J07HR59]